MGRDNEATQSAMDVITCVVGGEHRRNVLSVVKRTEPDLRELAQETDIPKTTLRHNLNTLQDQSLIRESTDRCYHLTAIGEATVEGFNEFESHLKTVIDLKPLFECIPKDKLNLTPTDLADADVVVSTIANPHLPSQQALEFLRDERDITAVLPLTPPISESDLLELLDGKKKTIELVVTADICDSLRERFSFDINQLNRIEGLTVWVVDGDVPYGIFETKDRAQILGLDDRGKPHVTVEVTSNDCVDWVRTEIERIKGEATRLSKYLRSYEELC